MNNYGNFNDLLKDVVQILEPSERLEVSEAASKYRLVNNPGAYVGPWKNETTPYMVEPMDVLASRDYIAEIFVGPAQSGKTDALLVNWVAHTVTCDPADMILYQTSQGVARDFSKRRIDRLHRHSPEVGKRLMQRSDSDNTHDKHYTSGMMLTLSWPTINEMSGRPIGKVALTDYDRMALNIDNEGSPFDLARKRTTTFGSYAMTLAESSPGHEVTDINYIPNSKHEAPPSKGILSLYNRGDRRRWYWPCDHCGTFYEPKFELLKWVDSNDIIESAESAKMMCPHCASLTQHDSKYELNKSGLWVPDGMSVNDHGELDGERERSDIASFWLMGVAASFASWKTLVTNYIKAEKEFEQTGDQGALKTTVNTDQGEPYFPRGLGSDRTAEDLKDRVEQFDADDYPVVPEGVRFLVATVDVQKNHWVVQVHGVLAPPSKGLVFDSIVIDRFNIKKSNRVDDDGDRLWVQPGSYLEDWDILTEEVIDASYELADDSGRRMYIKATMCDSGGVKGVTSMVYNYWLKLKSEGKAGKFLLAKGKPRPNSPRTEVTYPDNAIKGVKPQFSGQIPVMMINTNKIKDHVDNALDRLEPGGMIRFTSALPDSFYPELIAEQRDIDGKWTNPKKLRNESLDLIVYFFAVCFHLRIEYFNWDSPPLWASEWNKNSLVFSENEDNDLAPKKQKVYSTAKELGGILG